MPEIESTDKPTPTFRQALPGLGIIAALLVIVLGVITFFHFTGDSYRATKACKAWVLDQIDTPATADFSDVNFDGSDEVDGYLDAENDYGATVRSHFTCTMSHDSGAWTVANGLIM